MRTLIQGAGIDTAVVLHRANRALVTAALQALGATFERVSELSPELRDELADWDEGRRVAMGVLPQGPHMTLEHVDGRIRFVGLRLDAPDVTLLFKNLESAVMTFTGQIGAHTASVERRIVVRGNITAAVQASRALELVQKYLLPLALLRRTAKNPPRLTSRQLLIKARVLAGLAPRLLSTIGR